MIKKIDKLANVMIRLFLARWTQYMVNERRQTFGKLDIKMTKVKVLFWVSFLWMLSDENIRDVIKQIQYILKFQ